LAIAAAEQAMNERLSALYRLTEEERLLIKGERDPRAAAANRP